MQSTIQISVVGAGWLGLPLVQALARRADYSLIGTSSRADTIAQLTAMGAEAHSFRFPDAPPGQAARVMGVDVLVLTWPPGRHRKDVQAAYGREIEQAIAWARRFGTQAIIYTSSISVYGPAFGRITEESPLLAATESARAVVAAESALRASGIPTTILRLAGLFGGDRQPGRWLAGRTLREGDAPVNLVHRQDVIQAIRLVIEKEAWGKTYHVCAPDHPPKGSFYTQAARQLGLAPPRVEAGGADRKWIDSQKISRELNWSAAYPLLPPHSQESKT